MVYDKNGSVIETFSLGSPVSTAGGHHVYLIDSNDAIWVDVRYTDATALVDDSNTVL